MKIFAALLLLTTTAFAALPPFAQSSREITDILSDGRLYEILGSAERIDQIIRSEGGYDVQTKTRAVHVTVTYNATGLIGPAQYDLDFCEIR